MGSIKNFKETAEEYGQVRATSTGNGFEVQINMSFMSDGVRIEEKVTGCNDWIFRAYINAIDNAADVLSRHFLSFEDFKNKQKVS